MYPTKCVSHSLLPRRHGPVSCNRVSFVACREIADVVASDGRAGRYKYKLALEAGSLALLNIGGELRTDG